MDKKSNKNKIVIIAIIIILLFVSSYFFLKKKPMELDFETALSYTEGFKTIEAIEKITEIINVNTNPFEEKETNLIGKIYKNPFE